MQPHPQAGSRRRGQGLPPLRLARTERLASKQLRIPEGNEKERGSPIPGPGKIRGEGEEPPEIPDPKPPPTTSLLDLLSFFFFFSFLFTFFSLFPPNSLPPKCPCCNDLLLFSLITSIVKCPRAVPGPIQ